MRVDSQEFVAWAVDFRGIMFFGDLVLDSCNNEKLYF